MARAMPTKGRLLPKNAPVVTNRFRLRHGFGWRLVAGGVS
jgi:hypothetical protein